MKKLIILARDERPEELGYEPEHYQKVVGKTKRNYKVGDYFDMVLSLQTLNYKEIKEHVLVQVMKIGTNFVLVKIPNLEKETNK